MNLVDRYILLQQNLKRRAKDKLLEDYLMNKPQDLFIDVAQGEMLDMYASQLGLQRFSSELDIEFRGRAETVLRRASYESTPRVMSITQDYEPQRDSRSIRVRFSNDFNVNIEMSEWMFRNDNNFIHILAQAVYSHTQQYLDIRLEDIEEQMYRIIPR